MFSLNYFWFYLVACYFKGPIYMACGNPMPRLIDSVCSLALFVLLIIGFWKMPNWWMPIVMLLLGLLLEVIGAPSNKELEQPKIRHIVKLVAGMILPPVFTVLAYLGMFDVL